MDAKHLFRFQIYLVKCGGGLSRVNSGLANYLTVVNFNRFVAFISKRCPSKVFKMKEVHGLPFEVLQYNLLVIKNSVGPVYSIIQTGKCSGFFKGNFPS